METYCIIVHKIRRMGIQVETGFLQFLYVSYNFCKKHCFVRVVTVVGFYVSYKMRRQSLDIILDKKLLVTNDYNAYQEDKFKICSPRL